MILRAFSGATSESYIYKLENNLLLNRGRYADGRYESTLEPAHQREDLVNSVLTKLSDPNSSRR